MKISKTPYLMTQQNSNLSLIATRTGNSGNEAIAYPEILYSSFLALDAFYKIITLTAQSIYIDAISWSIDDANADATSRLTQIGVMLDAGPAYYPLIQVYTQGPVREHGILQFPRRFKFTGTGGFYAGNASASISAAISVMGKVV